MPAINEQDSVSYYNNLPGIRAGGGVLVFNKNGDLLLVKPNYRNTWSWPGGSWEPSEAPRQVAARECQEEIGCCPTPLQPAFVNYIPPRADGSLDVIHFVFTAEPVEDSFAENLKLRKGEIDDAKFVPIPELGNYMKEYRARAVRTYLEHKIPNAMVYLEDGRIID